MDAIAIAAQGVTKTYRAGVGRARVREMLPWPFDRALSRLFPRWWARDSFNALEDVSLSVPSGSSVGLVGHNGAGKTTLLRVIAGVSEPSAGNVRVMGRIAALLDVLVGFHPDLTGRENVYLVGAMHGFGRRAMTSRLSRILEFAEIDELADTPFKRYSAGMGARLGFAIITALEVEILLIDEVLAVGDAAFQRKCVRWLEEFRDRGGTLLFVSHNLSLVRNMTERALWLDHGRVAADGPTGTVLAEYARAMERRDLEPAGHRKKDARKLMTAYGHHRWGMGGARVEEVRFEERTRDSQALTVVIVYESTDMDQAVFYVGFLDEAGRELGGTSSPLVRPKAGRGSIHCCMSPVPFRSGIYFPVVAILSSDGQVRDRWRLDRAVVIDRDGEFGSATELGPVDLPATWSSA